MVALFFPIYPVRLTLTTVDYCDESRDECLFEAGVLFTCFNQVLLPHGQVSGANLKLGETREVRGFRSCTTHNRAPLVIYVLKLCITSDSSNCRDHF